MKLYDHGFLIPFIIALLISLEVGVFALIRYRTRLAFWCGLILLSLALELGCYLVLFNSPPLPTVRMFSLIQVISYSFFCVFWLLFVFTFTRHSHWINPLTMMIISGLPAVFSVMMLIQGSTLNLTGNVGSLMLAPQKYGISGVFFLAYAYAADFFTLFLLVRFYSKATPTLRRLILPLLVGPILLALAGGLELAGYNPFPPVSIQQLACSFCSLVGAFVMVDFRAGNIIREAQEMAFAQMQDGIFILDKKDRIIEMNLTAQRIVGISPKNGLNKTLRSIWPGKCDLISAQSEANMREGECAIPVNGLEYTFDVTISPIVDGYNELNGRIVALRNVTGRERIEKALSDRSQELIRTNSFLAALAGVVVNFQTMTDPAHIIDRMGSELYALGLRCFIARLEPESNELVVSYLYTRKNFLASVEKILGERIIGYRLMRDRFKKLYKLMDGREKSYRDQLIRGLVLFEDQENASRMAQILSLVGLTHDTTTIVLPLVTGERVLGLMGVWGDDLQESYISPLNLFASQVAWAIDRTAVYEKEKQRSSELARMNHLIIALSNVASILGTTSNSELVLETLGNELLKIGLNCAVVTINSTRETAFIQYLSFSPEIIHKIEKISGLQTKNYPIPRRFWPGDRILTQQDPIWYAKPGEIFRMMFPGVPQAAYNQAMKLLKFKDEDQLCILPLINGDRTIGAMPIWGADLKSEDGPILRVFGSQVAGIIENLANYENERRRTGELERSNAMIMALSNVAAQLDTTTDLSQVFETVGGELKKAQVNCMVGTLDKAKQTIKVEYLSISPDVIKWAEKLGVFWSNDIYIPRRLWPTDKAVTERVPYWDPDPIGSSSKMFPFIPRQIFVKTFEMAGMNLDDQVCYLPMISEEDVIGILAVWGPDLRHEDIPGLSVFSNQVATAIRNTRLYDQAQEEIVHRTQAEAHTRETLQEKEVLLKEVHHRVKNNLQVISSLLNLQAGHISDPATINVLRESQNRVRSMALIHEKLYQSNDLARIDFAGYLQSLVASLAQTYLARPEKVAIRVRSEKISLNIDTAIPCGLIVNELVSNSLKYAFPGELLGVIEVSCMQGADGRYILVVQDNGVGLPEGLDVSRNSSLGLKLVTGLVRQIEGEMVVDGKEGARFEITFLKR